MIKKGLSFSTKRLFSSSKSIRPIWDIAKHQRSNEHNNATGTDIVEKNRGNDNSIGLSSKTIGELLQTHHVVDLDLPVSPFRGSVVFTNLPYSGYRETSLRSFDLIKHADLLILEDEETAEKFMHSYFREEKQKMQASIQDLSDFETSLFLGVVESADTKSDDIGLEDDPYLRLSKEKKKLRDMYSDAEFQEMMNVSMKIIRDLDSYKQFEGERRDEGFYSSRPKKSKKARSSALDDFYLEFLRKIVFESKLLKRRGILVNLEALDKENGIEKLLQAIRGKMQVAVIRNPAINKGPKTEEKLQNLTNTLIRKRIPIETLPSPNKVSIALSTSGFPSDNFQFVGALPKSLYFKKIKVSQLKKHKMTALIYEQSQTILNTLGIIEEIFGERQVVSLQLNTNQSAERQIRTEIRKVLSDENTLSALKEDKSEIILIVSPFIPSYNRGIIGLEEESDLDDEHEQIQDRNKLSLGDKVNFDSEIVNELKPKKVIYGLMKNLEIDKESLSVLLEEILNVRQAEAEDIVDSYYDEVFRELRMDVPEMLTN